MPRCRTSTLALLAPLVLGACSDSVLMPKSPTMGPALSAKGPPPPPTPNVTATVQDADVSGNPLLTGSDDYNGIGFATYATASSRSGNLSSQITAGGGWQLLLNAQTTRTLHLVLASQGMAGIPDGRYSANVEVYTRCFDGNGNRVSILGLASGASDDNCTFGMDFSAAANKYKLALGPDYDAAAPTGRATVTCTAANGSCTSWTVAPNPSTVSTFTLTNGQVVSAPAANLYVYGKSGSLIFKGSYHNSFAISLAE